MDCNTTARIPTPLRKQLKACRLNPPVHKVFGMLTALGLTSAKAIRSHFGSRSQGLFFDRDGTRPFFLIEMALAIVFSPLYLQPRKRKRGGWRQRLADEPAGSVELQTPSRLALGHLLSWSEGTQSASKLRYHMADAVDDGMTDALTVRLANIAKGDGESNQHCHEGLMKLLSELPTLGIITPITDSVWTHVILPSSWICLLRDVSPRDLRLRLGVDKARVSKF